MINQDEIRADGIKRVILHIGAPKTGTTSLQSFCVQNWEWLLSKHGIYYPPYLGVRPHPKGNINYHNRLVNTKDNDDVWRQLISMVNKFPSANTLLLCSESATILKIFNKVMIHDTVNKVRYFFPGCECKVIYYIRRLDDFIKSYYNQTIKNNKKQVHFRPVNYDEFVHKGWENYNPGFHLSRVLQDCLETLGEENTVFRIFDRQKMLNNNIVDDFFSVLGLDVSDVARGAEQNEKLPDDSIPAFVSLYRSEPLLTGAMKKIIQKIDEAFKYKDTTRIDKSLSNEIAEEIDRIDTFIPGYKELFSKRKFSLDLPQIDMDPLELIKYDTMFGIFKYAVGTYSILKAFVADHVIADEQKRLASEQTRIAKSTEDLSALFKAALDEQITRFASEQTRIAKSTEDLSTLFKAALDEQTKRLTAEQGRIAKSTEDLSALFKAALDEQTRSISREVLAMQFSVSSLINEERKRSLDDIGAMFIPNFAQRLVLSPYGLWLLISGSKTKYARLKDSPYEFIKGYIIKERGSSFLRRVLGWLGPLPLM